MGWGSFDDQFHRMPCWRGVSYEARWLYVAMICECNALRQWDGMLPREEARCAVPGIPDFERYVRELVAVGKLVKDHGEHLELLLIDDFIPPPGQRPDVLQPRKKASQAAYRLRKCERGEHSKDCPPKTCPVKLARRPADRVTGNAGYGTGTGRKVTSTTKPSRDREADQNGPGPEMCERCGGQGCVDCEAGGCLPLQCVTGRVTGNADANASDNAWATYPA